MGDEESLRKLAELKSFLESKVAQSEEEVKRLTGFLQVIDSLLAEKSFRRVDISSVEPIVTEEESGPEAQPIRTVSGVQLGDIFVASNQLRVVPAKEVKFDVNSPPFRSFLLSKVLEPAQIKDKEASRRGELSPDKIFDFDIQRDGNVIREILIRNFGDERRLLDLKNQIRWTFRRMYEKSLAP